MNTQATSCCGLKEYSGLQPTPERTLFRISSDIWEHGAVYAHLILSDSVGRGLGRKFHEFISANAVLGKMWKTDAIRNPNSGNDLEIFIFAPNHNALKKWYDDAKKVREEEKAKYKEWETEYLKAPWGLRPQKPAFIYL